MATRKGQIEFKKNRIIKVLKEDPNISNKALVERFKVSPSVIKDYRKEAGVPINHDSEITMKDIRKIKTPEKFNTKFDRVN